MNMHLYLINDSSNSFKYVYAALMKVLGHVPTQAEQCCMIAHNIGRAHIKQGDILEIQQIQQDLAEYKITTEICNEHV